MAANCGLVTFAVDTTKTAGQTQDVTGFGNGATPIKWYVAFYVGHVTSVDVVSAASTSPFPGIGFCDGTNQRVVSGGGGPDGAGTSATARGNRNDCVIAEVVNNTGVFGGEIAHSAFITDGIRFVYNAQFATVTQNHPGAMRVAVLAGWGDAVCEVGTWTSATGLGNQTVNLTNGSLNIQAMIFMSSSQASVNVAGTGLNIGYGMADKAGHQGVVAIGDTDAQPNAQSKCYGYSGECLAIAGASVTARWSAVSLDTGSFTVNKLEGGAATINYYIALGGVSALVGSTTTETDTTSVRTASLGHTPRSGIFFSHGNVESTQDTVQAHLSLSIGGFSWDGTTLVQHAQACHSEDGNTTMNCVRSVEFDNVQITINATAASNDGTMRVKQISGGDVQLDNNQNADAANNFMTYLILGDFVASAKNRRSMNIEGPNKVGSRQVWVH